MLFKENRLVISKKNFNSSCFKEKRSINWKWFWEKWIDSAEEKVSDAGTGIKDGLKWLFVDKPTELIQTVSDATHKKPDNLKDIPKAEQKKLEKLYKVNPGMYYKALKLAYNERINTKNNEMSPFTKKLEEIEEMEDRLQEDRINREVMRRQLEPELKNKKTIRKYYLKKKKSASTVRLDKDIDTTRKNLVHSKNLPDANPEVPDTLLGHGNIKLRIYKTALKSKIRILQKELDYFTTQRDRAEYWANREKEKKVNLIKKKLEELDE